MTLDNTVIAITGGARGLGLAMARRLGRQGARLALMDLDGDALAVRSLGGRLTGCTRRGGAPSRHSDAGRNAAGVTVGLSMNGDDALSLMPFHRQALITM